MPALKSIPIRDPENNSVIGQRFEASESFLAAVRKNGVERVRPDGKTVTVNRKLAAQGHYDDKGFEAVTQKKAKE